MFAENEEEEEEEEEEVRKWLSGQRSIGISRPKELIFALGSPINVWLLELWWHHKFTPTIPPVKPINRDLKVCCKSMHLLTPAYQQSSKML